MVAVGCLRRSLLLYLVAARVGAAGSEDDDAGTCSSAGGCSVEGGDTTVVANLSWSPKSISVVLPCANEGEFAGKTVKAVAESVPDDSLLEIIIVDDGSKPPVSATLDAATLFQYKARIVRLDTTQGLIRSKTAGGNEAAGDIIVFFDCHVAPQKGWHTQFLKTMKKNYRRIAVPSITHIDVDTWTQKSTANIPPVSKCYLTWDADFKWYSSPRRYIPILSGGLLGISQRWWRESGGYDTEMLQWGGENIDQSLRTWLCGGEIVALQQAEVAHMWRTGEDKRTQANYRIDTRQVLINRARAAKGWFGENFTQKLSEYAEMSHTRWQKLDVSSIHEVQKRLDCKPFAWFLWRFREIYEDGGLVPKQTFRLKHVKTGKCLTYLGPSGTHPGGKDKVLLGECGSPYSGTSAPPRRWASLPTDPQRWHEANRNSDQKCCSGIRAWNTDQCIAFASTTEVGTTICEVSGRQDMLWSLTTDDDKYAAPGQLMHPKGYCVKHSNGDTLKIGQCKRKKEGKTHSRVWEKIDFEVPIETRLYNEARENQPELFK